MKKYLIITLISLSFNLMYAQYLPLFSIDETTWNVNIIGINGILDNNEVEKYSVIQYNNDTLLIGDFRFYNHLALKISVNDSNSKAWIYIEPFDKKILVYNMTLEKGDSFKLYTFDATSIDSSYLIVDTTYLKENRKVITFENNNEFYIQQENSLWRLSFVEGVGPSNFFMYGFQISTEMEYPYYIICKKTGFIRYESFWSSVDYNNCSNIVSIEAVFNENLYIYPNPVSDILLLSKPIEEYYIYDLAGSVLAHKNIYTKDIDISYLPKGVFYIKLQNKSNFKFLKFQKI